MRPMKHVLATAAIGVIGLTAASCGAVDNVKEAASDIKNAADNAEAAQKRWDDRQEKLKDAVFTVTWKTDDGEVTYAQDPPKGAFLTDNSIVIHDKGTITTCSNLDSEPECFASEWTDSDFFGAYGAQFIAGFAELASVVPGIDTKEFSETIAGRDADCVTADMSEVFGISTGSKGSITTCWDTETGVTLRVEETDEDGKKSRQYEAITFSTKVDSSLFTPPAKAKTMDDLEDEYKKQIEDLDLDKVNEELEKLTTTTSR